MSRPARQTSGGLAYLDLQNRARRERRTTQELLTLYAADRAQQRLGRPVNPTVMTTDRWARRGTGEDRFTNENNLPAHRARASGEPG
ncbi:MAG: hypothetical protein ACRDRU_28245 [Pseudonocardiaceae bacterium]